MHELGYTRDIIDTVVDAAQNAHANQVRTVYLTIGELRDIVDELFLKCFEHFSRGTLAEGAEVKITRVPFMVRCEACGNVYHVDIHDDATLPCPACGEKNYKITTGMEFGIDRVEIV